MPGPIWTLLTGLALGARITVDETGAGDFETLQEALDVALPGDFIVLEPGVYEGANVNGETVPIFGLEGPEATWIDSSGSYGIWHRGSGTLRIEGLALSATTSPVYSQNGGVHLRRVWAVGGSHGVAAYNSADWTIEASVLRDHTYYGLYLQYTDATVDQLTLLANGSAHLYLRSSSTEARGVLGWDGVPVAGCTSSSLALTDALYGDYGSSGLLGCVTATRVALGYDPDFVDYSKDGDWENDDLELAAGSPAADARSGCSDADGSDCDLGAFGGRWGSDVDSDLDGLLDGWEVLYGLDPDSEDGEDDADGDGLENLGEYLYGTDPSLADSDGDGVDDLDELEAGFDPLDASDQVPTALITGNGWGYVDGVVVLTSASSDPMGEALSLSWTLASAPSGSGLGGSLGSASTASLTPDVPGTYRVQLEVSDGTWSASAVHELQVFDEQIVRIPEDFATFDEVAEVLGPGVIVLFGAGEHSLSGPVFEQPVTLLGAGADQTTLVVDSYLWTSNHLRLQDLRVESTGSLAIAATNTSFVELAGVEVEAGTTAVQSQGLVVAWDSLLAGRSGYGLQASGGQAVLRKVRLEGYIPLRTSADVDARGLLAEGTRYAVQQTSGGLTLQHATLRAPEGGLVASGGSQDQLDHLVVEGASEGLRCTASATADFVARVGSGASSSCRVIRSISETAELGEDGVPQLGSGIWDGGDWRRRDPDGSTWDLGFTGGDWGYRVEHGLDAPWEDLDGDGLSAVTEWALGSSDEALDSDGDGVGDLQELRRDADPADPTDQLPAVRGSDVRTEPGVEVALQLQAEELGPCTLVWDSGETGSSKTTTPSEAGTTLHGWTLGCGEAELRGEVAVIAEEQRSVPSELSLAQALEELEDHHVLLLEPGEHVGDVDLRGHRAALRGSGPDTTLLGDVWLDQPASQLADLRVEGEVWAAEGSLSLLECQGLSSGAASGRYLLVRGDMDVLDDTPTFANLTVDGDLRMRGDGFRSSIWTGSLTVRVGISTSYLYGEGGADPGEQPFLFEDHDPPLLQPWPGSVLWDGGSTTEANQDRDGSREDAGYTGGPEAWPSDADEDLLNDAWEAHYGVDTPGTDTDADGLDELQEFTLGTDPTNPDTDGDRIPDGADPDPRTASGPGMSLELAIDDRFPRLGQPVGVSAEGLDDPLGELELSWELLTPPGSEAALREGVFTPDVEGVYLLRLELLTVDGLELQLEEPIYGRSSIPVAAGADLQEAIDAAPPGAELLLEGQLYEAGVVVDKDLVLRHASGARGGTLTTNFEGVAVIEVLEGARLRLEDLSLEAGSGGGLLVSGVSELRRVRILDGGPALRLVAGEVHGEAVVVLEAASLVEARSGSTVALRNAVLGYPDSSEPQPAMSFEGGTLVLQDSVIAWPADSSLLFCMQGCTSLVENALLSHESLLESLTGSQLRSVEVGDPVFLVPPEEATRPGLADLRLGDDSPAADAGLEASLDPDGSRADLGAHGGPQGNWPDVDEDRDGHTELEGDCDDTDPSVFPDVLTGLCPAPDRCSGCSAGGPGSWALAATLIGVGMTRRRRRRTG